MRVTISPSAARGSMDAPPSKSMAHRLLICAGLAEGTSVITNVDLSRDIRATMACLQALGADMVFEKGTVTVRGISRDVLTGFGRPAAEPASGSPDGILSESASGRPAAAAAAPVLLPCGESGSTLRFLLPLCLLREQESRLTGSRTLLTRPLAVYEKICRDQNLVFEKGPEEVLVGGQLRAGEYVLPGNVSSQFVSGLLFALPFLEEDSVIRLVPPVESRPYIDMTLQALRQFGIRVDREPADRQAEGDFRLRIRGGGKYLARTGLEVEGDYSNAAFFQALDRLGGRVTVGGLAEDSLQGDRVCSTYLDMLDRGFAEIDLSDCPDLGPVLMAFAAAREGGRFRGTRRLKIKESDRGEAMRQELAKMGARVEPGDNEILVCPGLHPPREILRGHNDHRIVMALSVLLTLTGGSIDGAEAVSKSLPDFFDRLIRLGIGVTFT
ncbi:MAG: 3-phosphoshikimate 1-carboxyvinyltransferase [Lachnospiraceae bacterium]|nr:3-phosphoshikimate 1-carboxyvinyltransferase [Lachnospiraceae bacterium]